MLKRLFNRLLRRTQQAPVSEANTVPESLFVFVRIPEALPPLERGARYEDPIHAVLLAQALGEVSGGGTQLSEPDEQGRHTIEWCGIDVDLVVPERGLEVLRTELRKLGAPRGTILEVHYSKGIEELDLYAPHQ